MDPIVTGEAVPGDAREVLLRIGSCAVYRTAAGTFVTGDLHRGGGTGLREPSSREGLGDGRWVIGGRLPAGATRAVGSDACDHGVWLAVTEDEDLAVRYEDDAGRIVAAPHPADWPREPVPDATEDCPACGSREWDRLIAIDRSRGWGSGGPSGLVVCRRCGHEVQMGTFMSFAGADDGKRQSALARGVAARMRRRRQQGTGEVSFPVYAVAGEAAKLGGHGGSQDRTNRVTVAHAACRVTSSVDFPDPRDLRHALLEYLGAPPWPELSQPALSLWLNARERDRRRTAAAAKPGTRTVDVEGAPVVFDTVELGELAAGTATVGEVRILIAGRWAGTAELRRVADPGLLA